VLVVDKPAGPTSHDVVDRVRRALGLRRVGHAGTLDPFATGVLPVLVGKATRLAAYLATSDKAYRGSVRFGFATSTDDSTGEALGPTRVVELEREHVVEAARGLTGAILQLPPAFSAKRIAGRRAYELAREGRAAAPAPVRVVVHRLEVLSVEGDRAEIEVECSSGTYVRALARDLGAALGVGAHLAALRRLRAAGFGLEGAVPWEELEAKAGERLQPPAAALADIPAVIVGATGLAAVRHGRDLAAALVVAGFPERPPACLRVLDEAGRLVAVAVPRGFELSPEAPRVEPVLHPEVVLI
jgi:tRNA pseudouridine55 synthase